jgi:antitoxin HicB
MTRSFSYPIRLRRDRDDGGFVVSCRDLTEVITQGDDATSAIAEAEGALQAAIESRIEDGMEIPAPSVPRRGERLVSPPVGTILKAAVYLAMREDRVSKSELARQLDVHEREVRRWLDPTHPTKVPALERALAALGRRVAVEVA